MLRAVSVPIRFPTLAIISILAAGCSGANLGDSSPPVKKAAEVAGENEGTVRSDSDVPKEGVYRVRFETSAGQFTVEVHRDWAPIGAQQFYELVKSGFYDECRFFRVVPGFMVQFGMNGDPDLNARWKREIQDDPVRKSNQRGFMTFAKTGQPNSRTTQVFINFGDNSQLDSDGFAPFGEVIEGMQNVDAIYSGYGERPDQGAITSRGNEYLNGSFPNLDFVKKATILSE
ncbi:MAG: peptidylprolyl isomerase [Planctomyces sp.]|jgi:peptidyl-prolyl cis-trans isomerase A (cyclophilin A)